MQTFETMDWEAEAKNIALALGLQNNLNWRQGVNEQSLEINTHNLRFRILYTNDYRSFWCDSVNPYSAATVRWDGTIISGSCNVEIPEFLKLLFHLSLITPEVEQALGVTITAHQTIEWGLDYESRLTQHIST